MTPKTQSARTKARDATALLKKDHETVRELLKELEKTSSRSTKRRQELLERIALEVQVHAAIEEELFYPAFRRRGETKNDEKLFFEAAEEHKLVHGALPEIQATDPESELFSARAKVLKDLIEHHAEEEEQELFPRARELMSREELQSLGVQLEERKMELQERWQPNGRAARRARSTRVNAR
jgi:hemerythrin-like domain-containing protein